MSKSIMIALGVAAVALLVAIGAYVFAGNSSDRISRQAQANCLANTDAERKGSAGVKGQGDTSGVGGTAEVGSRDVQKRGASERVPVDQVVEAEDRIRKCIADYVAAHESRR